MVKTLLRPGKRLLKGLGYALFLSAAVWALLELAWRGQWVDFYAAELQGLNPASALQAPPGRKTVLFLGDSFSAQPGSYIDLLRDRFPDAVFVNAAVPGTGILEANVIARERLRRFPPDVLVYQIYVGNDLWDIRKTSGNPRISVGRNLYWRCSDQSLFLRFLNYKLGQVKNRLGAAVETRELKQDIPFSPALYNQREKLILRAEPALLQNSAGLKGGRAADMDTWLQEMDALLALLPQRTRRVVLLVVPHCAQVNRFYAANLSAVGAAPFDSTLRRADYPFLKKIEQHFAADARVRVLSPLAVFQQQDSTGRRLYFENDPHLSREGHRVLGEVLGGAID